MTAREQIPEAWVPAWKTAHAGWNPLQPCPASEFLVYVEWLRDEEPQRVAEAFRALAGRFRPTPAQIRAHLHRDDDESRVDVGRGHCRAMEPQALQAVAEALEVGEDVCDCDGSPMARQWRADARSVWRCPTCSGLEQGQVFAAQDREAAR